MSKSSTRRIRAQRRHKMLVDSAQEMFDVLCFIGCIGKSTCNEITPCRVCAVLERFDLTGRDGDAPVEITP